MGPRRPHPHLGVPMRSTPSMRVLTVCASAASLAAHASLSLVRAGVARAVPAPARRKAHLLGRPSRRLASMVCLAGLAGCDRAPRSADQRERDPLLVTTIESAGRPLHEEASDALVAFAFGGSCDTTPVGQSLEFASADTTQQSGNVRGVLLRLRRVDSSRWAVEATEAVGSFGSPEPVTDLSYSVADSGLTFTIFAIVPGPRLHVRPRCDEFRGTVVGPFPNAPTEEIHLIRAIGDTRRERP